MLPNFQLITRQLNRSQTITNGISRELFPSHCCCSFIIYNPHYPHSSTTRSVCPPDHKLIVIYSRTHCPTNSFTLLSFDTMTKCGCELLACSGYSNLKAIGAHGEQDSISHPKIRPQRRPLIKRPSWFCNRFPCSSGPDRHTGHGTEKVLVHATDVRSKLNAGEIRNGFPAATSP